MINRGKTAAGCLLLLWTAAAAQQPENSPAQSTQGAGVLQSAGPITPMPAHPVPFTPPLFQPVPVGPAPVKQPQLAPTAVTPPQLQPAAVTPPPAAVAILVLPAQPAPVEPPLEGGLGAKIPREERYSAKNNAAAKRDFDLRQAKEKKQFDAASKNKDFWENRRLARQFRAAQAKARKEFNEEQERKRKTYERRTK